MDNEWDPPFDDMPPYPGQPSPWVPRWGGTAFPPGLNPAYTPINIKPLDPSQATVLDLAKTAASPLGLPFALVPLYQILHGLVLKTRRVDISDTVGKTVLVLGAAAGVTYLWNWIKPTVIHTVTCSVTIPLCSPIAGSLEAWIGRNTKGTVQRHKRLLPNADMYGPYPKQASSTALQSGWFWYEGHPLFFRYSDDPLQPTYAKRDRDRDGPIPPNSRQQQLGSITISGLHWVSEQAVTRFISRVSKPKHVNREVLTAISVLIPGQSRWHQIDKPARSLATIDLDQSIKEDLLADVERYVSSKRRQWYANRGIPYRRGYLFYGPPGTGKTSTATAIAGKLRSELFIASLAALKDDRDLKFVFSTPRQGDVLLLEDVDSAGIVRENMKTGRKRSRGIKLADLLNAIDGASSPEEGIVLIMTTNDPESLDPALIRSGRIDHRVHFGEVSQSVARSIFMRMYQDDEALAKGEEAVDESIKDLATAFAQFIPDKQLTPAEVQEFLIPFTAQEALDKVEDWVKKTVAAKAAGKNIADSTSAKPPKKATKGDDGIQIIEITGGEASNNNEVQPPGADAESESDSDDDNRSRGSDYRGGPYNYDNEYYIDPAPRRYVPGRSTRRYRSPGAPRVTTYHNYDAYSASWDGQDTGGGALDVSLNTPPSPAGAD